MIHATSVALMASSQSLHEEEPVRRLIHTRGNMPALKISPHLLPLFPADFISQAARMLAVLIAKHEYDARYQLPELKLYIAQLYMPIISMVRT